MDNCWLYTACNHKDCEASFCQKRYKLDRLYELTLLPETGKKYFPLLIDKDQNNDLEAFKRLSNIEQNIDTFISTNNHLFLYSSNCGCGKTSWAIRFIKSYLSKVWASSELCCRALFISVPKFLSAAKDNITTKNDYFEYIKENCLKADLVVWDDIFHKSVSEYEYTQLLTLIDNRTSSCRTNIFTSNLSPEESAKVADARLVSRVTNTAIKIELVGSDKRGLQHGGDLKW